MIKTAYIAWKVFFILSCWLLLATQASADRYNYKATAPNSETKYQRPEDLLDKIPFVSDIPRTFIIGDGFKMNLSLDHLRIDHMGSRSRSPASKRTCLIGFSYTTPVAGFFTSRIDLPLFTAAEFRWSEWTTSTLGDYVAYFSKDAVEATSLRFVLSAKF
ncbi:MAG: hypothetical protein WC859_06450 [Elusimicrobiota bacterium]|jgi:hypothetical protein